MASNRLAQGVGAMTSGVGAQAAHEADLGPFAELGAGLAGGFGPAAPAGLAALTRGAFRGGEAGRQRVDRAIDDFKSAGTTPTVGQATGLIRNQILESTLGRTPGASGVVARKAQDQASEIQSGLNTIASRLAPSAEPGKAGLAVERGITGPGGFVDRFKSKSGELYDQLDNFLPPETRVPTGNTANALSDLVAKIPGAPNLSKFFINAKVANLKGAFDADTVGDQSALNRGDVAFEADRLRNIAGDTNASAAEAAARQNVQIDKENVLRTSLGQKPKPYVDAPSVSADDDIASLLGQMQDGRLPYAALKKLRTLVGEEVSSPSLASDVKSSAWKKLYAGISEDLKAAAEQAGPEAQQAWTRANNYFKAGNGRIESLDRVANPTNTAIDCGWMACLSAKNIVCHTGTYAVSSITAPTTATSFGMITPKNGNGAHTAINDCTMIGFYNAYDIYEHATGDNVNYAGCNRGMVYNNADHASSFGRICSVHCVYPVVGPASGAHTTNIKQLDIEHASGAFATVSDLLDTGSRLYGVINWYSVAAGTPGPSHIFTNSGGQNCFTNEVGNPPGVRTITSTDTALLRDNGGVISYTGSSAVNVTIPQESSVPWKVGTLLTWLQTGTGQITVVAGGGVTITPAAPKTRAQTSFISALKTGTNTWTLLGDLA